MWIPISREEAQEIGEILDAQGREDLSRTIFGAMGEEPNADAYVAAVRRKYAGLLSSGDLDLDDEPVISPGYEGAFVLSWLYVYDDELEDS